MTLALQLFKKSNDTREKLRLNFHSLSVSELLEYGRQPLYHAIKLSLIEEEIVLCCSPPAPFWSAAGSMH